VVREHYDSMLSHYGIASGLRIARKHIGWYSKGLPGSAEFRAAFNRIANSAHAIEAIAAFYRPLIERLAA
jgi:tRNA-dihydrouridine synthase B